MLKIRWPRPRDRLIFNMGIPIPGKDSLYIETGPWGLFQYPITLIIRSFNISKVGVELFSVLLSFQHLASVSPALQNFKAKFQSNMSVLITRDEVARSYGDILKQVRASVPLTLLRSNSKLDKNLECSSLKYDQPITAKFCTCHDSYTVEYILTLSTENFGWISNLIEILLVGWAPVVAHL